MIIGGGLGDVRSKVFVSGFHSMCGRANDTRFVGDPAPIFAALEGGDAENPQPAPSSGRNSLQ